MGVTKTEYYMLCVTLSFHKIVNKLVIVVVGMVNVITECFIVSKVPYEHKLGYIVFYKK